MGPGCGSDSGVDTVGEIVPIFSGVAFEDCSVPQEVMSKVVNTVKSTALKLDAGDQSGFICALQYAGVA
jgi:methyl coenzyme M reductase subunit C